MIFDFNFAEELKQTGVNNEFIELLSDAYQKFSEQIMMELTFFKYKPETFGFSSMNLISKEYAIQKYFEPRIETYVRQYLVIDLFSKILESQGYEIYNPSYTIPDNQYVDGEIFCSNKEFEQNAGFELIIHDESNKLIGCRFTDILAWDAKRYFGASLVTKIIIIDWHNINGVSIEDKKNRTYGIDGNIDILGINEFTALWFGKGESKAYELFLHKAIQSYQEIMGICSMPKLTAPALFELRLDVERDVLKRKSLNSASSGYEIIDINNYKTQNDINHTRNINSRSEKLLFQDGLSQSYYNHNRYKAFVGKSDFSKSFLTSEYLYSQYNENDLFDYTSIVSGYLKSIEQLLYAIVCCFIDKGLKIKNINKDKKNSKGVAPKSTKDGKVYKIDFTTDNINCIDSTIGSLIHFIQDNYTTIFSGNFIDYNTIIDCLECYRIECRNDSFHKHNNYDWARVTKIRHNTLLLYQLLLGDLNISDLDFISHFKVINDDRLERIYYWLRKKEMYAFRVKFNNDNVLYQVQRKCEQYFPVFNDYGMLRDDFCIKLICHEKVNNDSLNGKLFISRENIPEEIWYTTYVETYPIDFSI